MTQQTNQSSARRFSTRHAFLAMSLAAGLVLGAGCASSSTSDTDAEAAPEVVYDPQLGMTKEQIKTMYQGEPDRKARSSDGSEVWTYHTNAGAAFIPFNYGYRPEYHVIHFNGEGVVVKYETSE